MKGAGRILVLGTRLQRRFHRRSTERTISDDCYNTHLINELDIPVAVLGLSNVVVATGADGILVTEKSSSPRLKEFISHIEQRPMYEERRWGWYRVLDLQKHKTGMRFLPSGFGLMQERTPAIIIICIAKNIGRSPAVQVKSAFKTR